MPVALISTSTSPALGPSRSSSTISSGFLASNATAARLFILISTFPSQDLLKLILGSARLAALGKSFAAHTGIFSLLDLCCLVLVLGRPYAADGIMGARPKVDVDVIEIADD